jgi:hypothetical protein
MSSYYAAGEPIKLSIDLALAATTDQPQVLNSRDSQNDRLWKRAGCCQGIAWAEPTDRFRDQEVGDTPQINQLVPQDAPVTVPGGEARSRQRRDASPHFDRLTVC